MKPVTALLTRAANRALEDDRLRPYAGRLVKMRVGSLAVVWRIGADGRFSAVSPLLDGDVRIVYKTPAERGGGAGDVVVEGDAALLNVLSEWARRADFPLALSGMLGPVWGARALFAGERARDCLADCGDSLLATAAQARDFSDQLSALRRRLEATEARAARLVQM